LSDDDGLTRVT